MSFTFKDYLVESTILEGGDGSGRPGDNDRPNKSLWFKSTKNWYGDMNRSWPGAGLGIVSSSGDSVSMSGGEEEEVSDDLYVVDKDQNCYGCWRKGMGRGITFNKPRPLNTVKVKSNF